MLKRTAAIVLAVTFLSLAIAPETLAQRGRRGGCDRTASTYYRSSGFGRVAGTRYYSPSYYGNTYSQPYYGNSYSQPYYASSVGNRYIGRQYYGNRYGNGEFYRGRRNSTRNLVLTVAAPAAIGAGIGAIAGGGKGAGIGALVGGGGGALYYLLKNRSRRR